MAAVGEKQLALAGKWRKHVASCKGLDEASELVNLPWVFKKLMKETTGMQVCLGGLCDTAATWHLALPGLAGHNSATTWSFLAQQEATGCCEDRPGGGGGQLAGTSSRSDSAHMPPSLIMP